MALYYRMGVVSGISDFEIRLHRADGTVSIVMPVAAFGPHDAKHQAAQMLKGEISYAVIWQDLQEIATVHRAQINPTPDVHSSDIPA